MTVTRDDIRFGPLSLSPVPGFDRMTGFRTASIDVSAAAGLPCHLLIEMKVSDEGAPRSICGLDR